MKIPLVKDTITKDLIKGIERKDITHAFIMCRSGNGMNIYANKHNFIRCALIFDEWMAEHSSKHNAANVWAIPSNYVDENMMKSIIDTLLNSNFIGCQHQQRVMKTIGLA